MRDITYDEVVSLSLDLRGLVGVSNQPGQKGHRIDVYVEDKATKKLVERKLKVYKEESEDDIDVNCVHVLLED